MPAPCQIVDDACGQRRFRADHDKLDFLVLAEGNDRGVVRDVERDTFGLSRNARISRRTVELIHQRACADLPRQCVFASAGTEDEDVHAPWL